jgi:UDP-sugar pyrophosphorylase
MNSTGGFSPFPGNINQIIFKLAPYAAQLKVTGGAVAEFVNPKYKDPSRTAFKKPTRLECMMQDYPKTLPPGQSLGFTTFLEVLSYIGACSSFVGFTRSPEHPLACWGCLLEMRGNK